MVDLESFKHGAHPYIDQLLQTATKGNVTAEHALYVDRMCLFCKICKAQLTVPEPEGTDLDYGVQEFIKIHAHVGGHYDKPKCTCGGPYHGSEAGMHALSCPVYTPPKCTCKGVPKTGPFGTYGQVHHPRCPAYVYVPLTPVTADFKPIGPVYSGSSKPEKSKVLKIATGRKFR